ncbi:hypothetical protein BGZ73_001060 [Actinomortierella ambigua]|nr:hypothetical protein BGZ73_001060 [Actinomortierella ambigua]
MFGGDFGSEVRYARSRLDALTNGQEYIVQLLNKLPITDSEMLLDSYNYPSEKDADGDSVTTSVRSCCSDTSSSHSHTTLSDFVDYPYSVFQAPKVDHLGEVAQVEGPRLKAQHAYQGAMVTLWESYQELCNCLRQFIRVTEEITQDLEFILGVHSPASIPALNASLCDTNDTSVHSPYDAAAAVTTLHQHLPMQQPHRDEHGPRHSIMAPVSFGSQIESGVHSPDTKGDPERLWSSPIISHMDAVSRRCSDSVDPESCKARSTTVSSSFGGEPYLGPFQPPIPKPCTSALASVIQAFIYPPVTQCASPSPLTLPPNIAPTSDYAGNYFHSNSPELAAAATDDAASCYSDAAPSSCCHGCLPVQPEGISDECPPSSPSSPSNMPTKQQSLLPTTATTTIGDGKEVESETTPTLESNRRLQSFGNDFVAASLEEFTQTVHSVHYPSFPLPPSTIPFKLPSLPSTKPQTSHFYREYDDMEQLLTIGHHLENIAKAKQHIEEFERARKLAKGHYTLFKKTQERYFRARRVPRHIRVNEAF